MLGTHPDISTIGERRKFFNKSIQPKGEIELHCSCGQLFKDCHHWNTIKTSLLQKTNPDDLTTNATEFQLVQNKRLNYLVTKAVRFCMLNKVPRNLWPYSKKITQLCHFNKILVQETLKLDGKSVFLDSSKGIDQAIFLSLIPEFDFYIIWLSRDPRAQVHSARKYNDWTIEEAAINWKREMADNEKVLHKMNIPFWPLQYEALCRNPKEAIKEILRFTGLDASEVSLNFRQQTQHIMGNYNMRMGSENKIVERKDWMKKLSKEQISVIEKLTIDFKKYYAPD